MSKQLSQHAEWLSLIEVSGPFLAEPILKDAFPQGLEKIDPYKKKQFRQTYDEWRETINSYDEESIAIKDKIHAEWINWVIKFGLEWDEDEDGDILKHHEDIPEDIKLVLGEHNFVLKPEFAVYANVDDKPYLLLTSYPIGTKLEEVVKGDSWSTTPAERMAQLCRAVGCRLGIITNGEQWLFIDAPDGGITTYASWYARLWSQETVTLQAFYSLFNIGTIFNGFGDAKKLTELLDQSLKHQDEVTETLGIQVSRAVEVLIQSIDRINHDHNGKLLEGVEPSQLYEAGLTLMMRLVFLLCAEERDLLLLGDETYESNYALSTLRLKLREEAGLHGEEVLSYRKNAWARLLAIFRAVYGGVEHENMRMPALGGSLFDPDRFPFLEGRTKGSNWKIEAAKPLPIDNRTVLLFLDAIQIYKGRTLSYRALDVEQIGYVYEGLLEKTVVRATDVTLELTGSKSAKTPWVELKELASAELDGEAAVKKLLKDRTKSSAGRITSDLNKDLTDAQLDRLLAACHNDTELRDRIKSYYHFLRLDAWSNPLLYPKNAFMLTTGDGRRETGTHYTPKSLTESIVKETLVPTVYIGPAEGEPREKWELKSSTELLDLKICDLAMGSGAFLVQVCRWLAERVCEAWLQEEKTGKYVSAEGELSDVQPEEQLPIDAEERLVIAKRLIAERCLYGVDINPLAVELAKLSIWLVTLSKGRPFGFLDHNLKHGDSLLGLHNLNQLYYLDMNPSKLSEGGGSSKQLFAQDIEKAVKEALDIRKQLRQMPIHDIHDIEVMIDIEKNSKSKLELPTLAADALIGGVLANKTKQGDTVLMSVKLGEVFSGKDISQFEVSTAQNLEIDLPNDKPARKPFHWCIEFPEVFENTGFDCIVGNPPFLGGKKIGVSFGSCYLNWLNILREGKKGSADLCADFFVRAFSLIRNKGCFGLIASNSISQGGTRQLGLSRIVQNNGLFYTVKANQPWPGVAGVDVSVINAYKGKWDGKIQLNSTTVKVINSFLAPFSIEELPVELKSSLYAAKGTIVHGNGFVLDASTADTLSEELAAIPYIRKYIGARDLMTRPDHDAGRWVIDFGNLEISEAKKIEGLFDYITEHVKPHRDSIKGRLDEKCYWKHWNRREKLYAEIAGLDRVLVCPEVSKHICFSFLPSNYTYQHKLVVIPVEGYEYFGLLNSNVHAEWAWYYSSTMRNAGISYSIKDCLNNFPLPEKLHDLKSPGMRLYFLRDDICSQRDIGFTDFLNLINSPDAIDDDLVSYRKELMKLDEDVCSAFGITDIEFEHDFIETSQSIRFTLSDSCKYELIERLIKINLYQAGRGSIKKTNLLATMPQASLFE